jgi:hypothetical protein
MSSPSLPSLSSLSTTLSQLSRSIFGNTAVDVMYDMSQSTVVVNTALFFSYYIIGIMYYMTVEKWSTLQCLYFSSITAATIGYGTLHPSTDAARVFTSFYIIYGLVVFFKVSNNFSAYMKSVLDSFLRNTIKTSNIVSIHYRTCIHLFSVLLIFSIGMIAYSASEEWTANDSFYYVIVTMTTIGYGDENVIRESSLIFSLFYILLCVLTIASLIFYLEEINSVVELEHQLKNDIASIEMSVLGTYSDIKKDRDHFTLQMLLKMNIISHDQIDSIIKRYTTQRINNNIRVDSDVSSVQTNPLTHSL